MSRSTIPEQSVRSRRSRLFGALALGVLAVGAAACGSSSSSPTTSGATTSSSPTSTSSGATTTTAAKMSTKAEIAALAKDLSGSEAATGNATYSLSGNEGGKSVSGTIQIAHSGGDELFGFVEGTNQFQEIKNGKTSAICAKSNGTWNCYNGSIASTIGASLTEVEDLYGSKAEVAALKANESGAYGVSTSSQTIGGQSASCTTFKTHTDNGSYTVCITSAGVLAKAYGSSTNGTYTLTLTSYSSSVPASVFTFPATPKSLP